MELKSEKLEVVKILKKTRSEMFRYVSVGDIISLSLNISYIGDYAPEVKCENVSSGAKCIELMYRLASILECFDFKTK